MIIIEFVWELNFYGKTVVLQLKNFSKCFTYGEGIYYSKQNALINLYINQVRWNLNGHFIIIENHLDPVPVCVVCLRCLHDDLKNIYIIIEFKGIRN